MGWTRTPRIAGRSLRHPSDPSSPCLKWAGYTTATSDAPRSAEPCQSLTTSARAEGVSFRRPRLRRRTRGASRPCRNATAECHLRPSPRCRCRQRTRLVLRRASTAFGERQRRRLNYLSRRVLAKDNAGGTPRCQITRVDVQRHDATDPVISYDSSSAHQTTWTRLRHR